MDDPTEQRKDAGLTKEDIERLIVNENVGELDRVRLFLSPTAHQLQQSCALSKLPSTFLEYGLRAYHALIPTITASLDQFSPEMQAATGEAIYKIVRSSCLPKDVTVKLLPTIMNMLTTDRSEEVVYAWLDTLCEIVPLLPRKVLTENLLKLALSKGQAEESTVSKLLCARIYGAVAPLLEGKYVEQHFLQKAMALCQDTDTQVRACMCRQLNPLARAVGLSLTEELVLPELCELLNDEEPSAQSAAIDCLLEMLDSLPPHLKQLKILPIIRSMNDATMLPVFGEILTKIGPGLQEQDMESLMRTFRSSCSHEDENIKKLCAYNFPAVLKCIGSEKYVNLQAEYVRLVQDPSPGVRAAMAASFHEISKMLGKDRTALYLKEPLIFLLKDNSRQVLESLVPILQHVLGQFSVAFEHQRSGIYASLIPPLLEVEKTVSGTNQWRLHLALLDALPHLPEYISSDQIYEHFVPICFHYMMKGSLQVRTAATYSLAIFVRQNKRVSQRYELSQRIVKEFGHGQSYWLRLVYIEFCDNMLKTCSSQMFKDMFLDAAIHLLQDAVVSVRMRACLLIPLLKSIIKLPDDVQALERINFYATQRLNDNDRNVAAIARSIADSLKHANTRSPGSEKSSQAEFELMDKQREEEEWNMLSKEEQDEKKKLDDVLHRMKLEPHRRTGHPPSVTQAQSLPGTRFGPAPPAKFGAPSVKVKSPGVALCTSPKQPKPSLVKAAAVGLQSSSPNSARGDNNNNNIESADVSAFSRAQTSCCKPGMKPSSKRPSV